MEYTFRKLDRSGFDLLIPLMRDCFGMDVNIDYFKWKYLDNPAGEFIGFIAVSPDNEIGAYYGVIPELYSIEGKETLIYQLCDTMTHSSHRRKGLFQKLAKMCYAYLEEKEKLFVIGFGGAQSTPGFLKFGWLNPFSIRHYFFPKIFTTIGIRRSTAGKVRPATVSEIKDLLPIGNLSGIIHSVRSEKIFSWRIANPRHDYKLIAFFNENNEATGYVCFYETDKKIFLFDQAFKDTRAGKALMNTLKKIMAEKKLKGIVAFCQEKSAYSEELKKYGFISNPFKKGPLSERTPFIFYAGKMQLEKYNHPFKWLINSFDHDAL